MRKYSILDMCGEVNKREVREMKWVGKSRSSGCRKQDSGLFAQQLHETARRPLRFFWF